MNVSDLEKTLVDCADRPEFCGGIRRLAAAMTAAAKQGCSWATVAEYLQRLDNGAATKRIVYLSDQLDIDLLTRETLVPKDDFPEMVSGDKEGCSYKFATLTIIGQNTPIVLGIEPVREASAWEGDAS